MEMAYLLPCTCGKTVTVTTAQAGLQVLCDCGRELTAPTMLGLRKLPEAPRGEVASPAPTWTLQQGFAFLGSLLVLAGLLVAGFSQGALSTEPTPAAVAEDFPNIGATEAWEHWMELRKGPDLPREGLLEAYAHNKSKFYEDAASKQFSWTVGGCLLLGVGVAMIAGAVVLGRGGATRQPGDLASRATSAGAVR